MTNNDDGILAKADSLLEGKDLYNEPRAFLLLSLTRLALLFDPGKMEHYWNLLLPVQNKVPESSKSELEEMRSIMETASTRQAKGFVAEVIAAVQSAVRLAESDREQAKVQLRECETRLGKKRLALGKGAAWIALLDAWTGIDRGYALGLIDRVPGGVREPRVLKMNRSEPLTRQEWQAVVDGVGFKEAVKIALKALDDEKPVLNVPSEVLSKVAEQIRGSMTPITGPQDTSKWLEALNRHVKLVNAQVGREEAELIPRLQEELFHFLATTPSLDRIWLERFNLIGAFLASWPAWLPMPDSTLDRYAKTRGHLGDFVRAHYAGVTASADTAEEKYRGVMQGTGRNPLAEAWFLVMLVRRGLAEQAVTLAEASDRAGELMPRLRRVILCGPPETESLPVAPGDMAGDPIGEFLAQSSVATRVTYLRTATNNGARTIPGAMWAGVGTEEEPEGLRGFWKSLGSRRKTLDEMVKEYLKLNPLYSSYSGDTSPDQQFTECLRINGYGNYKYQDIDQAVLGTLVAWDSDAPDEVRSVLQVMWQAIEPDDTILRLDWLRNAILSRCQTVFPANPEAFLQVFLKWLKKELIDKGRVWRVGNTQITLRYPKTAAFQFCVMGATAVTTLSPERRDRIILSGLREFELSPQVVEVAAQLYNSDKERLDLTPPSGLVRGMISSWQMGIVRNAIPVIMQKMLAGALQQQT